MRILIVGAGVVGSATGKGLHRLGHSVTFVDVSPDVVSAITKLNYNAYLPQAKELSELEPELVMICVPTPEMANGQVNTAYVYHALEFCAHRVIRKARNTHPIIVLRSTVPPGTTRNQVIPALERLTGMRHSEGFSVVFNPEFLRAVSAEEDFLAAWVIVAGAEDFIAKQAVCLLYEGLDETPIFTSLEVAETVKYVANCFNATKISFANEMWLLANQLQLNGDEILSLASRAAEGFWNPSYGTKGGQPFGGSCLPKDTAGLAHYSKERGIHLPLLNAVIEVNNRISDLVSSGEVSKSTIEGPNWSSAKAARITE